MPSDFIRSAMRGRWFHIPVARSKNERGREIFARSGPTFPPTPFTAWHLTQPLAANTREPASGSWLGLSADCAQAASRAQRASAATRTAHLTGMRIRNPFHRDPAAAERTLFPGRGILLES